MTIGERFEEQRERERQETQKKLFAIIDKIMAHNNNNNNKAIDKRVCGVPQTGVLSRVFD